MLSKLRILWHFLRTRQFYDQQALARHQQRALRRLLTGLDNRFYPTSQNLADFAVINKQIFMENFAAINRLGISNEEALAIGIQAERTRDFSPQLGKITVGLSSGTSGSHGVFLASEQETAQWAGYILRRMLPKPWLQQHKIAFFLRANSNLYESVHSHFIRFAFYDLQIPLREHVVELNRTQPTVLIAPAGVLTRLINEPSLAIKPQKVISVAEVLEDEERTLIEAYFGQVLHQIYQCTEGFLAHSCRYGNLHLNEDIVFIEKEMLEPNTGRFVPIVTDFRRTTQPVIRYRLDDVLIEDKTPCACGSVFTRLHKVEGRCDDVFQMESLAGQTYLLFPDFVRHCLMTVALNEYAVIKQGNELQIHLQPLTARDAVELALQQLYVTHKVKPLVHRYLPYSERPLDHKRRRVQER